MTSITEVATVLLMCQIAEWPEAEKKAHPKTVANILLNEVLPRLDAEGTKIEEIEEQHYGMTELVKECAQLATFGLLQSRHVKKILADCWKTPYVGYSVVQYLRETKLLEEASGNELLQAVQAAMAANPKAVAEFKGGKDKAIGAIVGAVMKKIKADPSAIQALIKGEVEKG